MPDFSKMAVKILDVQTRQGLPSDTAEASRQKVSTPRLLTPVPMKTVFDLSNLKLSYQSCSTSVLALDGYFAGRINGLRKRQGAPATKTGPGGVRE